MTAAQQRDQDLRTIGAMQKFGGAFIQALAKAASVADEVNLGHIKCMWSDEWDKYQRLGEPVQEACCGGAEALAQEITRQRELIRVAQGYLHAGNPHAAAAVLEDAV